MKEPVGREYNPEIGANFDNAVGDSEPASSYVPDLPSIKDKLRELLDYLQSFRTLLEREMNSLALVIPDNDAKLKEANSKEWPDHLGSPKNYISYPYYRALRRRQTASASYIRKRFEEAARDVGGTTSLDLLHVVGLVEGEALLVQEFLNEFIGSVDDSSEYSVLEIFEEWIYSAERYARQFRAFQESGDKEELLSQFNAEGASTDEADRAQAVFKVSLNLYNDNIRKNLDFLRANFANVAPAFYKNFLGPSVQFRLNVSRKALGFGSPMNEEVRRVSNALDERLVTVIADQSRRKSMFDSKMESLYRDVKQRDRYREYVEELSAVGTSYVSELSEGEWSDEELEAWWESKDFDDLVDDTEESFVASHKVLDGRELDDAHPQYLLRSGGNISGAVTLDDDATIDGLKPSTHAHTGEDGSERISGKHIVGGTLSEGAVDTSDTPPIPSNLKILSYRTNITPPGAATIEVDIGWDGDPRYSYEVQHVRIAGDD